ncbi:MAG: hypothetical protein ACO3PR_02755 [Limisphaerales bacterium]
MIPSSFATLATKQNWLELELLLGTLAVWHRGAKVFSMVDDYTWEKLRNSFSAKQLEITWIRSLNDFTEDNRASMEEKGTFKSFLYNKFHIMRIALKECEDVIFLDSDTIILDSIKLPAKNSGFAFCQQRIPLKNQLETGHYNCGVVWVSKLEFVDKWEAFTESSRYFEQASLENLVTSEHENFTYLSESFNLMPWPQILNNESKEDFKKRFKYHKNKIYYNHEPLRIVHTHFDDKRFNTFNETILELLVGLRKYKELLLITKRIHGFFTLTIPKQPRSGIYGHANDSFRELAILASQSEGPEFILNESTNTNHCWLEPNILLNDRPTLEWVDEEFEHAQCILLGNGDIDAEGKSLDKIATVKPWIFWPRNPRILENYLNANEVSSFSERKHLCTFIGNIENSVQEKNRKNTILIDKLCDVLAISIGKKHKYSQEEYLNILRTSKFGLCLPGYGKKCHREIECMALGTVPILHENIPAHSYGEPLIEGVHYLKYTEGQSNSFLETIKEDRWVKMSKECQNWYLRNVHSEAFFQATLRIIFGLN